MNRRQDADTGFLEAWALEKYDLADQIVSSFRAGAFGGELRDLIPKDFLADRIFGDTDFVDLLVSLPINDSANVVLQRIRTTHFDKGGIGLDFGSGYGELNRKIQSDYPGLNVVGIDTNEDVLLSARRLGQQTEIIGQAPVTQSIVCDVSALSLRPSTIDLGFSSGMLRYLIDKGSVADLVTPGSRLRESILGMLDVLRVGAPLVIAEIGDAGSLALLGRKEHENEVSGGLKHLLLELGYMEVTDASNLRPGIFMLECVPKQLLKNTALYFLYAYSEGDIIVENINPEAMSNGLSNLLVARETFVQMVNSEVDSRLNTAITPIMDLAGERKRLFLRVLADLAGTAEKNVYCLTVIKGDLRS